jgi:hypothetical protein
LEDGSERGAGAVVEIRDVEMEMPSQEVLREQFRGWQRDHVPSASRQRGRFQSDQSRTVLLKSFHQSYFTKPTILQPSFAMTVPVFETIFAVPMTCQSCINDIEGSLQQLSGTSAVMFGYARHLAANRI